jgi:hypothetical protein
MSAEQPVQFRIDRFLCIGEVGIDVTALPDDSVAASAYALFIFGVHAGLVATAESLKIFKASAAGPDCNFDALAASDLRGGMWKP